MHSSVHLRSVYSIPVIFSFLFSWISCSTVQRWDDDWNKRVRWTPFPWNKFTFPTIPPQDGYYKNSITDEATINLALFIPIGIILLLLFLKFLLCDDNCCCDDSSTSASSRTVHAPPRRSNTPRLSTARQFRTPSMTGSRVPLLRSSSIVRTTPNRSSRRNGDGINASRTNNVAVPSSDRPPDYSVVVISDLSQNYQFPEVRPAQYPDSPPPKYDEMGLPKF